MSARPITVGEFQARATPFSMMLSELLVGLAAGKYDPEVALEERILSEIGLVIPAFAQAEKVDEFLLFVNRVTAGSGRSIPDGRGGAVTQSWAEDKMHILNPDGSFKY